MTRDAANVWTQHAEKVLRDRGITTLPIDPFALAAAVKITVQAKPDTAPGVSGLLMRLDTTFGIMYATHIANDGFQRFSVAHELGHYFLPGHIDAVFADDAQVHVSRAGFMSDDKYENQADHFAAGLLMPDPMFHSALIHADDGLAGIDHLSSLCRTSLTATAIRYADRATIPAAVVVSTGNRIDYCFMSGALRDFAGLQWIMKGTALPPGVLTRAFNANAKNVADGNRDENSGELQDWFHCNHSVKIREEVVGLGAYGRTLTIITCDTFADEENEDEELEKDWTPRFG